MQFKQFFTAFLFLPALGLAQPLSQLLTTLPNINPTLQAGQANLAAERERLKQARAAFLPNITLDAATGLNSNLEQDKYRNAQLRLVQPLFAGGRDKAAYDNISSQISAAEANYAEQVQQQRLALIDVYLSLLTALSRQEQTAQYVGVLSQNLAAQEAKFASGESSRIDVMQATAFLERGKADDANAAAQVIAATTQLEALLNAPLGADFTASWPELPAAPESLVAAQESLSQHPQKVAAAANVRAAEAVTRGAYGQLLPTINAEATAVDYSWSSVPDNQTLGVTLSMPLFVGGSNISQIRQAKNRVQVAEDNRRATENTLRQNITTAWHNLEAASANMTALTAAEAAQAEATAGIKARYDEGEANLLETLEAEQDLLLAQTATTEAKRTHILSAYQLRAATGQLVK